MTSPPASRPASRDEFEIAIVCALPLEYNAVVILLDHSWDKEGDPYGRARGDNNTYTTGSIGGFNIVVLLLPGIGKVEAAASAASLRSSYPEIKLLFLNGICGGVPNVKDEELLLGDVIISKTVVQYDFGNLYPDAFKTKDTIDERLGRANKDIRSFTAILETDRGSDRLEKRAADLLDLIQQQSKDMIQHISKERGPRRRKIATYAYPGSSNDKLFEASYRHKHHISPACECSNSHKDEDFICEASRELSCDQLGCDGARLVPRIRLEERKQLETNGKTKDAQAPSVFIGRVGSGDTVLKSGIDRDRLAREHGIIAFETEGSGIWDEFPCIIVKGVCDYADSHKNKHEDWQNFAAAAAASVVKGLIEHYPKTDQRVTALAKNPIPSQIEDSRKNRECLRDLRSTDPVDDKKRIQMTKGGLLRDSYAWILTNDAFLQWRNDPKCPLLWIRGNPGKGKTMLLCGILDEMDKSVAYNLSYFFCQQTDSRINNSVAILRGLIYMLVRNQPSLIAHVRTKYDEVGKAMFEDQNAWVALSQILTNILQDPSIKDTILIIDALDECSRGLDELLRLIVEILSSSTRVKLLVSSRNEWDVQRRLEDAKETSSVSLELNATSVAAAVASYIRHKVQELKVDNDTQAEVEQYLTEHANGTFLWVALVCDNLKRVPRFQVRSVLAMFPPGLDHLYERMMQRICDVNAIDPGRQILAIALAVHRPLTILELASLVEFNLPKVGENEEALCEIFEQIPGLCGSFLVLQDQTVYFVHQSAKDFLVNKAPDLLFPSGRAHHQILTASLSNMKMTLKKDIYALKEPGYSIYDVPAMDPDPLAAVRYSCVFWIDHFLDSLPQGDFGIESNDQYYKPVEDFLRSKYLYWLEALALLRNIPEGVTKMQKLEKQVRKIKLATSIKNLVRDACRFIQEFVNVIHDAPLQTYVSALLFSPKSSLIHQLFEEDMPKWVIIGPKLEPNWRPRMLEGHYEFIESIVISCRGDRLASISDDNTIRIWDTGSGILVRTIVCAEALEGVVFSPMENDKLATHYLCYITIWDVSKDGNQKKLQGENFIKSISLSPRRQNVLASVSDGFIELWNTNTCETIWRWPGSGYHLAFSASDDLLAWSTDNSIEMVELLTGASTHHRKFDHIKLVSFLPKCGLLAVLEYRGRIKFWDSMANKMTMELQYDRQDDDDDVRNVCFSADSSLFAANCLKSGIWIWETAAGNLVQNIPIKNCHSMVFSADKEQLFVLLIESSQILVLSVTGEDYIPPMNPRQAVIHGKTKFSPDANLFTTRFNREILLWNSVSQTSAMMLSGYSPILSPDSTRLACSPESSLQIWRINSSPQKLLFKKNFRGFFTQGSATLSQDWKQVAISSRNGKINIWDTSSGKRSRQLKEAFLEEMVLVFSLDGKRLAAFCLEPWKIGVWDLVSGSRTTTTLQEVTSPELFQSFIFKWDHIYHLKGFPNPNCTFDKLSNHMTLNRNLGLPANRSGFSIAEGNTWLTYNNKRVLWLPPRYRPDDQDGWDANAGNTSNETTLCKQNFTGRNKITTEPKVISHGDLKAILGKFKDIFR